MIDYTSTRIKQMAIHRVGSRESEKANEYSKCCFEMPFNDSPLPALLNTYFLSNFKRDILYHFDGTPSSNITYGAARRIFDNHECFFEESKNIAMHIWNTRVQPLETLSELYVVEFNEVRIQDTPMRCIGIFMSESKESYLKVLPCEQNYKVESDEGFNIKKLDKGCLILEMDENEGYVISIVNTDKKKSANAYWVEQFLGLTPRFDQFFFTQNYLNICKGFVEQVYNEENDVPRTEQIDLMNRSYSFFQNNKQFSEELFAEQVMDAPDVRDAFLDYKASYEQENDIPMASKFVISNDAVKKQNRFFKSVIKLDKNFHVYVHGNGSLIEKGYDRNKGMNFYQLFFDAED